MNTDLLELLRRHDIAPSAQRVAVANYVLFTDEHPSADQIWSKVQQDFPLISRATVYNTLHLFVEKGLLRALDLAEGRTVYDPKVEPHHHFIDVQSGHIHDIPWNSLEVRHLEHLTGFAIDDYQVVLRGKKCN